MRSLSAHKLLISPMDEREGRRALEVFSELLGTDTQERQWQEFFDKYPTVLAESLSVRFTGLFRQVSLISGKPDYVFVRSLSTHVTGDYGVIELKRPDQPIIGQYSTKHIVPSQKVVIAKEEASRHLEAIRRGQFLGTDRFIIAGNRQHAFIIIGRSSEITRKCKTDLLKSQFQQLLPAGFHLYTFDEVFELFASGLEPVVHVLTVSYGHPEGADRSEDDHALLSNDFAEKHYSLVRGCVAAEIGRSGMARSRQDVSDIVQDVFVAMMVHKAEDGDFEATEETAVQMATSMARRWLVNQRRLVERVSLTTAGVPSPRPPFPKRGVVWTTGLELKLALGELMEVLTPEDAQVARLRY